MTDVRCHRCGEPWEVDTFHDVAAEKGIAFNAAYAEFRRDGCYSTGWYSKPCEKTCANGDIVGELAYLLGDDIDGMAALLEDFGL